MPTTVGTGVPPFVSLGESRIAGFEIPSSKDGKRRELVGRFRRKVWGGSGAQPTSKERNESIQRRRPSTTPTDRAALAPDLHADAKGTPATKTAASTHRPPRTFGPLCTVQGRPIYFNVLPHRFSLSCQLAVAFCVRRCQANATQGDARTVSAGKHGGGRNKRRHLRCTHTDAPTGGHPAKQSKAKQSTARQSTKNRLERSALPGPGLGLWGARAHSGSSVAPSNA